MTNDEILTQINSITKNNTTMIYRPNKDGSEYKLNIKAMNEARKDERKEAYNKGVEDALSVAVNHYNCPDYIRDGVKSQLT